MPRRKSVPAYGLHKATGQARVIIAGKHHYLGEFGSPESHERYQRAIAEWRAGIEAEATSTPADRRRDLTVAEIMAAFVEHAVDYYRRPDGTHTNELCAIKQTLRVLKTSYGSTPAAEFGPLALKAVRQSMVDKGWTRGNVNRCVDRIRRMFRWAVENEMVPPSIYHGLKAVVGLRAGRSDAKESVPVKPVPLAVVAATLPFCTPPVAAMIKVQLRTGARPGEITSMRGRAIDTSGEIWVYKPEHHKNSWHGHDRAIYIGPKAQRVLRPFLKADQDAYLFLPAEGRETYFAERRANRKSKITPSQAARKRKSKPKRAPRDHYDTMGYCNAVRKATNKANAAAIKAAVERGETIEDGVRLVPTWHPHQLRHTRATELRRQFGIDAARVILGHRSPAITETYAQLDRTKALEVVRTTG